MSGVHSDREIVIRLIGVRDDLAPTLLTAIKTNIYRYARKVIVEDSGPAKEKGSGKSKVENVSKEKRTKPWKRGKGS
jgi:hypothetical protein